MKSPDKMSAEQLLFFHAINGIIISGTASNTAPLSLTISVLQSVCKAGASILSEEEYTEVVDITKALVRGDNPLKDLLRQQ